MPRAPAQPKRDPRLRALKPPVDPWGWIVEEPVRRKTVREIEYNIDGMDTKPSFYVMVKTALLANKMHYVRGVTLNAICKHVAAHWPVDLDTYRRLTRVAIKRAVEAGKIETVEGPGVAYRLAAAERGNRGNQSEDDNAKPKRRGPARGGVVASKRGTTGKAKRADSSDEEDSEDEPPRKASKKTAKKNNSSRVPKGDHLQQQPGEGKWVWQYQDGGWHDYDPRGSDEVEQTYQLYEKEKATGRIIDVRSVRSGAWEYQVDFRQFTQQNVRHEAHTVRAIRRIWRSM